MLDYWINFLYLLNLDRRWESLNDNYEMGSYLDYQLLYVHVSGMGCYSGWFESPSDSCEGWWNELSLALLGSWRCSVVCTFITCYLQQLHPRLDKLVAQEWQEGLVEEIEKLVQNVAWQISFRHEKKTKSLSLLAHISFDILGYSLVLWAEFHSWWELWDLCRDSGFVAGECSIFSFVLCFCWAQLMVHNL